MLADRRPRQTIEIAIGTLVTRYDSMGFFVFGVLLNKGRNYSRLALSRGFAHTGIVI